MRLCVLGGAGTHYTCTTAPFTLRNPTPTPKTYWLVWGGGALRPCTGGSRTLNAAAEAFKKGDVTASGPVTDDATYLIPGDIGQ